MLGKLHSYNRFIVALLLVLSSICSLLISPLASATSDYDGVFDTTSAVRVSDTSGAHTCASEDISMSWGRILLTESYWSHSVGQSYATTKNAFQAALKNGAGWAVQERLFLAAGVSIGNYTWGPGDTATQITFTADDSNYVDFATVSGNKYAIMHADSAPVYTVIIGQHWNSNTQECSIGIAVSRAQSANSTNQQYVNEEMWVGRDGTETNPNDSFQQLLINSPITYPTGYEGEEPVALDLSTDTDGDNLALGYETVQGTSDTKEDTDGDGIDDLKESVWYQDRGDVFCGAECAYPNPTKKDLYVEIDWMKDSNNRTFMPSTTQLNLVRAQWRVQLFMSWDTIFV